MTTNATRPPVRGLAMRRAVPVMGLATMCVLFAVRPCDAGLTLSLERNSNDQFNYATNSYSYGSKLSVDVRVTGIDPGDPLDSLSVGIFFPDSLLGAPEIQAGEIIQDTSGFSTSINISAQGIYLSAFSSNGTYIYDNGVFMRLTFDVMNSPGDGHLAFDGGNTNYTLSSDSFTLHQSGPNLTLGSPLSFNVGSNDGGVVNPVPEPSTLMMGVLGVAGALGMVRWKHGRGRARAACRSTTGLDAG